MISRRLLILGIIGGLMLIGIIGLIIWVTSSKNSGSSSSCQCAPDQICVNNQCVSKTNCGPRIIPAGEHCDVDNLLCDKTTNQWHCNGPTECSTGYEGIHCTCDMSKRPGITDACAGLIPVCNEDGSYTNQQATTCLQLENYFSASKTTIAAACHDSCPINSCGIHGECQCTEYQGSINISCFDQCTSTPDPTQGECSTDGKTITCPDQETCICDVTTGYQWQCVVDFDPQINTCPPIPPHPTYCPAGDLQCVPCIYQGVQGSIRYCPGSGNYPFDCLVPWFGLEQQNIPIVTPTSQGLIPTGQDQKYYTAHQENDLPVFQTVDNYRCEQGLNSNTYLQTSIGLFYNPVGNPAGNIISSGPGTPASFLPYTSSAPYYVSSNDPANICYWSSAPNCTSRGLFHQYCGTTGHDCTDKDPASSRLKDGHCVCDLYNSAYQGKTVPYQGLNCQFSDADCNNLGIASTDSANPNQLVCACSKPNVAGNICQYTRDNSCGGHGNPLDDGTCTNCDSGWIGNHCQYSRDTTCSGHGDPNELGQCNCDAGWAAGNCSFNVNDPSTAWVATCKCASGISCVQLTQTTDLSNRVSCYQYPSNYCALGPDMNSAMNNCGCGGC